MNYQDNNEMSTVSLMVLNLDEETHYQNDEEPLDKDLNVQYQLFCTRKANIEKSMKPTDVNKEVFYGWIEQEPEVFHETEEY